MFKKLICFWMVVKLFCSDTTEEDYSYAELPPITFSSMNSTLEVLNEHGANPMNKPIALRSSDSLSGLGISANLLGVHAGAGLDHDRRGYDNMCQGFSAKPAGSQYPYPL
ncbi:uncharacterized protein LOC124368548 [Homalodisca vitripennis]|uniref:uncharacterized protein LOC124368548 n=1 Tax=Homalodisca vitripennis TaxID=197043 RepID=UPI001EEB0C49|nr:uncharacterized protein LOC124368548 [Homalodisca vitripennis]